MPASSNVAAPEAPVPAPTPVRNVVFDMGGVLMTFDGPHFASLFTESAADAELLDRALFDGPLWPLLDAGVVSHQTVARYARAHLPERLHPALAECIAHWPEHSEPIAATNDLAIRLRSEGYGIYLLSNASTRIMEQLDHMPAMPHMMGHVVSAEERVMKPDPELFAILCARYGLDPAECLFVDDNPDNCEGARVAGMRAWHFTGDVEALEAAIHALS